MNSSSRDWQAALAMDAGFWEDNPEPGSVVISSFEDEGGEKDSKDPGRIFQTFATLGFRYTSCRFIDWQPDSGGDPVTMHVEDMSDKQLGDYGSMKRDFGLSTWSLGGRGGKVYAHDDPDKVVVKSGSGLQEKSWSEYCDYLKRCAEVCLRLGSKLYRGFAFYRCTKDGTEFAEERRVRSDWSLDRSGEMAEIFTSQGLLFGFEEEPNLEWATGFEIVELLKQLGNDQAFYVKDNGNMAAWGYTPDQNLAMFIAGLPYMLWWHWKDYAWTGKVPKPAGGPVDEENLLHFCPCDRGRGGHVECVYFLSKVLPYLNAKAVELGLPGFGCELETHLWGGGQFGGLSRHEGIGVGLRAMEKTLAFHNVGIQNREWSDIRKARQFKPVNIEI